MTEALKACPFCGCEQWPISDKNDYWGPDGDHRNGCVMGSYDYFEFADKAAMIAAWTQRATPSAPAVQQALEALQLAQPIVESDHDAAKDSADADWEGLSYLALTAVNAVLAQAAIPALEAAMQPSEGEVERVARAICRADPEIRMGDAVGVIEQRVDAEWSNYEGHARAAIAARGEG